MVKTSIIYFCITSVFCLFFPTYSFAHKVNILSWIQEDYIYIESTFANGNKIKDGNIEVYNSNEDIILTGKTDQNGCFFFKLQQVDSLKVAISTTCGHKNYIKISHEEIKAATNNLLKDKNLASSNLKSEEYSPTIEQINKLLSDKLDQKLQPIYRLLAKNQQKKITIHDIIGSIGYILGLVGLGSYIKYNLNKN